MNLVLLEPGEEELSAGDARAIHLRDVLRRGLGDRFDAGVVNGPIGSATVVEVTADAVRVAFAPRSEPPPLPPVTLIVGLPRPATARDILRDATTLGVGGIHFVACERATPSYAASSLWRDGEWRKRLLLGAAQAFDTRLPVVTWHHTLAEALDKTGPGDRLALDNYEAVGPMGSSSRPDPGSAETLAIGPERGWGPKDRAQLRAAGFTLRHLGPRVLRVEMAVVAALAILQSRR